MASPMAIRFNPNPLGCQYNIIFSLGIWTVFYHTPPPPLDTRSEGERGGGWESTGSVIGQAGGGGSVQRKVAGWGISSVTLHMTHDADTVYFSSF
jgi:hypothetical protein